MPKVDIDTEKLIDHLKEKWKDAPCPMCGNKSFQVADKVFELREFAGGDFLVGGGPLIPIIPVTCENCGNTIMINAVKINLIKPQSQNPQVIK